MALPESGSRFLHALAFAVKSREGQRHDVRPDSSIEHSIEVAELLDKVGVSDTDTLVAVVVRATVADGAVQASEFERLFGAEVRAIVDETVPPRELGEGARLDWSLRRLPSADHSARAIQLATTVVTLRHVPPAWSMAQRASYFEWVERLRAAVAGTNAGLEGLLGDALRLARSTRAPEPLRLATPVRVSAGAAPHPMIEYLPGLRRIRSIAGRFEEWLEDFIGSVEEGSPLPTRLSRERPAPKRARKYSDAKFVEEAKPGVRSVTCRVEDDGTLQASIDRGEEFELSPALADLLVIITRTDKIGPDGLVAFQTIEAVAAAMRARRGHSSRRAVTVAISRLRERLYALNYAPLFVETSYPEGVRFRLRVQTSSSRAAR